MDWQHAFWAFFAAMTALVLLIAWMSAPYKHEGQRAPGYLLSGAILAFVAFLMMLTG